MTYPWVTGLTIRLLLRYFNDCWIDKIHDNKISKGFLIYQRQKNIKIYTKEYQKVIKCKQIPKTKKQNTIISLH